MSKPKLGDLLVEANLIDEVQMRIALEEQKRRGSKFGSTLLALGFVDENVLTAFLSKQLDMPCVSLNNIEIAPRVRARLTREQVLKYHAVPVRLVRNNLSVALTDPLEMDVIEALERETGLTVAPMVAPESSIAEAIERLYPDPAKPSAAAAPDGGGAFPELAQELEDQELSDHLGPVLQRLDRLQLSLEALSVRTERLEGTLVALLERLGKSPG